MGRPALFLSLALLLAGSSSAAAGVDTVFVVPGSHLDLGYTAPLSEVRAERVRILDRAIDAAVEDSDFVWFEEGGWSIEAWLDRHRGDLPRLARARELLAGGQLGVGALLLSPHAAAFPEALPLLTLHLGRLERELGYRPRVAVLNDVPSAPAALVEALAAAGVRYLLAGPNMVFTPPLPDSLVHRPFFWQVDSGARVLVFVDPDGFTAGFDRWGLPPECGRFFNPRRFPAGLDDERVFDLGVRAAAASLPSHPACSVVQHALDNWDPSCAIRLPAAVRRWNARDERPRLVLAQPETYFERIEARFAEALPVVRGEWGGDWDAIRASEPVWTWRLRQAMERVDSLTPRAARLALAAATDHNVGLGPRWSDGSSTKAASGHVRDVGALYREAVAGVLGSAGLEAVPARLDPPAQGPWPAAWRSLLGERDRAARVRVGPGFIHPIVDDSVGPVAVPLEIAADERRLVVRATLDRGALERLAGPRYRAVIELTIHVPPDSLRLAPERSAVRQGGWWRADSRRVVVAPAGVRVTGPSLTLRARGPLLSTWTLAADPGDPGSTRLQALALMHATEGTVEGGRRWRQPFAALYPGEPAAVEFELELERLSPP